MFNILKIILVFICSVVLVGDCVEFESIRVVLLDIYFLGLSILFLDTGEK